MADTIQKLYPSDIISESMHKINNNFALLSQYNDISEYKWQQYVKAIDRKLKGLKDESDVREDSVSQDLERLQELINSMASKEDIQRQVNDAINNAQSDLSSFISRIAGEQISSRLGAYATTSQLYEELGSLDYVRSDAFDMFTAKANEKIATASRIVANSKFAEEDGKLVYIDGSVSPYSSINDYWDSLSATDKASIDPQGKGLGDPDVLEAFMNYCETKFKTVYSELTAIRQAVGDGSANVDIMAAINGDNGEQIVSAIFMKANEEGSGILLTADHVQIDADKLGLTADDILIDSDHILALQAGSFSLNSNNFRVGLDGTIWANNATLEGDITANTFKTNSGLTVIGSDGILHAENAEIKGNIEANSFSAHTEIDVNEPESGVTGHLSKNTRIDGESFNIGVTGTLDIDGSDSVITDGNSLYIKIMNTLPNPEGDNHNDNFGDYLYGVPVLCMTYNGVEYTLSPASWFNANSGGGDTSNMRFIRKYYGTHCSFNRDFISAQNSISVANFSLGDGVSSTMYIFRNDKTYSTTSGSTTLVSFKNRSGASMDTVYQFQVINWGGKYSPDTINMLNSGSYGNRNIPLFNTSSFDESDISKGAYTLKSILGTEGLKFADTGGVQTVINDTNRDAMIKYLYYDDTSIAKEISIIGGQAGISELTDDDGVKNIINMMLNLMRLNPENPQSGITGFTGLWETNAYTNNDNLYVDCRLESRQSSTYEYNINDYLPFDEHGSFANLSIVDKGYSYRAQCYPVCEIKENGKTHSAGTKQIVVHYEMYVTVNYGGSSGSRRFPLIIESYDPVAEYYDSSAGSYTYAPIECYIDKFTLNLDFYAVFDLNTIYPGYNPSNSVTDQNIRNLIQHFLTSYDFNNNIGINSTNHNNFYNFIKFSGEITGVDARRNGTPLFYNTIKVRVKSR